MFNNPFKPIEITITREEYNELVKAKITLQRQDLANRLVEFGILLHPIVDQLRNQLQEKQEYCDYLEIESNKTEALLEQEQKTKTDVKAMRSDLEEALSRIEHLRDVNTANKNCIVELVNDNSKVYKRLVKANIELKAKDKLVAKVRAENDRVIFREANVPHFSTFKTFYDDLPKPTITKGEDEKGEYTDKTYILAKTCSKCQEQKPLDQFHKQAGKKGGVRSECKECRKLKSKICY